MALIETESLVIKSYNLAEADRIVVFLTRDHGVVRGVAKGAKKLKSRFGSGLEPFSVIKVTYFEKETVELVSIQKAELIRSNFAAASNPDFLQKFSYLGDLLITLSPPHDPNEVLYRMVKACIEAAADDPVDIAAIGLYFELWIVRLSGYMPDWSSCDSCQNNLEHEGEVSVTSNFHLLCPNCRRSAGGRTISKLEREISSAARKISPREFAARYGSSGVEIGRLSIHMKQLVSQAIGREVMSETSLAITN